LNFEWRISPLTRKILRQDRSLSQKAAAITAFLEESLPNDSRLGRAVEVRQRGQAIEASFLVFESSDVSIFFSISVDCTET